MKDITKDTPDFKMRVTYKENEKDMLIAGLSNILNFGNKISNLFSMEYIALDTVGYYKIKILTLNNRLEEYHCFNDEVPYYVDYDKVGNYYTDVTPHIKKIFQKEWVEANKYRNHTITQNTEG